MELTKAREVAMKHWKAACKHEKIPEDASFACFSKDNPHAKKCEKAMERLLKIRAKS